MRQAAVVPQEGWGPGSEPSPAIPTATQLLPLSASFHITVSEPSLPQMQSTASASKALSIPAGPCKHPPCPEPPGQPCPALPAELPRSTATHPGCWCGWGPSTAPALPAPRGRGTKGEHQRHRPKDRNGINLLQKGQSHSYFPGVKKKRFWSLQIREKVIIAFQNVLQKEDKSACRFKRSIMRNRALDCVTSSPK